MLWNMLYMVQFEAGSCVSGLRLRRGSLARTVAGVGRTNFRLVCIATRAICRFWCSVNRGLRPRRCPLNFPGVPLSGLALRYRIFDGCAAWVPTALQTQVLCDETPLLDAEQHPAGLAEMLLHLAEHHVEGISLCNLEGWQGTRLCGLVGPWGPFGC